MSVYGADDVVSWFSQGSKAALLLSDFTWTAAPESMQISFATNGGNEIAPTNVAPGTTYGALPDPQREGDWIFGGWYLDEEMTEEAKGYIPFHDHTVYAMWIRPLSLLETGELSFEEDGFFWSAVEGEGASGGWAIVNARETDETSYLYVECPNSNGTLRLSYRLEPNECVDIDGQYVYGPAEWTVMDVELQAVEWDGSEEWDDDLQEWVQTPPPSRRAITICKYGAVGKGSVALSDFEWIPAPETITVSFDPRGGAAIDPVVLETADETFGILPSASHRGWSFEGWYMIDGSKGRITWIEPGWTQLPLHDVTLHASWSRPVSDLNTDDLTFTSSGAWYASDDIYEGNGLFADGYLVDGKEVRKDYKPKSVRSWTQATMKGPLLLSFDLEAWESQAVIHNACAPSDDTKAIRVGNCKFALYVDGKAQSGYNMDAYEDGGKATLFIPAGKHTVKWELSGTPHVIAVKSGSKWHYKETSSGYAEVSDFHVVRLDPQDDMASWTRMLKNNKSWIKGDLSRFAALYKARMIASPDDYEARILFAATRLGVLAENKQFTDYAKTFGLTVDWARLCVTPPTPKFDKKSAAMNTMVDKTIALATPAINEAKAALEGIPEDWPGTVELNKDEWPLDDTVAIDSADVLFARAGLDAALAGLNFLGAYDLTVNWPKVNDTVKLMTKIPAVKALPKIGDTNAWETSGRCFRAIAATAEEFAAAEDGACELSANAMGAMAVNGTKLALHLSCPTASGWFNETNQVRGVDFDVKSGDTKLNVYARVYGEAGMWNVVGGYPPACEYDPYMPIYENGEPYCTTTNVTCWVEDYRTEKKWKVNATIKICDSGLLLNVDMAKVNLGTAKKPVGFAKKSWTVGRGEVEVGTWEIVENSSEEPEYVSLWTETGLVTWHPQSDAERRVMKFINDQKSMFSKVRDAARLGASRRLFKAALERALVADGKATARSDEAMHFFEYDLVENQAVIDCARANTQRALAAIDAPTDVDFMAVAAEYDATGISTNKLKLAEFNYTLLPNEGVTKVYLGALFEGKITRDLLPPMRTNAYGEIVPDFDAMQDPTIGGLFPEMTHDVIADLTGRFEDARELDHGEWTDPESLPKPGEKLDLADYKGYDVSGLPKGWTWNKKTGVLTPTTTGTFSLTFKKGKTTVKETIEVGPKPAVLLFADDETAVAVTGTGLYNVGATVKAVAAVQNGYAFGGWFNEGGEMVSPLAVYSFKMTREDVVLTATTIPLENDKLQVLEPDDPTFELSTDAESKFSLYCESVSPFTVSALGLPPGLVVSNAVAVMDGGIVGFAFVKGTPEKAGVYYTTFVAKNNGGYKRTVVRRFVVDGAEESVVNTANIDLGLLDESTLTAGSPFNMTEAIPPAANGSAPKSIKAKGVPGGMKATFANGNLQFGGVPTTAGKYDLDITVTYANKKTAKTAKTIIVHDSGYIGGTYIPTGVLDNDPNGAVRGTVNYVGVKQYGQTVKFTATTKDKKKWFFGGWFLDEACTIPADAALPGIDFRAATVSALIGDAWMAEIPGYDGMKGMYACFVTKGEESDAGVQIDCEDIWRVKDDEGVATQLPIAVASATKPALTASGLPAGTKLSGMKLVVSKAASLVPGWYKVTLTAKTAAGNTAKKTVDVLVPNVTTAQDMGLIEGLYTGDEGYTSMVRSFMKAGVKQTFTLEDLGVTVSNGWTLAVTGLPSGWTYNANTGEFSGAATKVGKTTVTFTVSQKVGRKTTSYKATATFDLEPLPTWATGTFIGMDGNAYVRMDVTAGGAVSGYRFDAAGKKTFTAAGFTESEGLYSTTLKGKGVSLDVVVGYYGNDKLGVTQGLAEFPADGGAFNSPWALEGATSLPVFAEGASVGDIAVGNGKLTMKFGEKGVVTCVYKVGANATSGTTQICALTWDESERVWQAHVAVALDKKVVKKKTVVPVLVKSFLVTLPADAEGTVDTDRIVVEEPMD